MKAKVKSRSFIHIGVLYFGLYSLILLGILFASFYTFENVLLSAFPTFDQFMENEQLIKKEQYDKIPMRRFRRCDFLVFNEEKQFIYATEETLKQHITSSDLWLINNGDASFDYQLYTDPVNPTYRIIMRTQYTDGVAYLDGTCTINAHNEIVSGSLFGGKKYLTNHEIQLIEGRYERDTNETLSIVKYEYATNEGKRRTLVFICPIFDTNSYERLSRQLMAMLPIPVMTGIFLIVLMSNLFHRRLQKSVHPISQAIVQYGKGERVHLEENDIYDEYREIIDSFESLIDQLDEAQQERVRADQEKRRIIANLSHDLKTPLTVIQGYAKAYLDGVIPADKFDEYISTIYAKAIYSSELMDTLSAYTKMDYPEYQIHLETLDFNEYVREYLASKYSEIDFAGFELIVDIDEEPLIVDIDTYLFIRCFNNLIDNSIKYNSAGTHLYFTVKHDDQNLQITIADDGIGIEESIRDRVFEPFVTENNARTSGKGTGLGMAIVRSIVERHEGTIALIEPPHLGKGAEFEIVMPLRRQPHDM